MTVPVMVGLEVAKQLAPPPLPPEYHKARFRRMMLGVLTVMIVIFTPIAAILGIVAYVESTGGVGSHAVRFLGLDRIPNPFHFTSKVAFDDTMTIKLGDDQAGFTGSPATFHDSVKVENGPNGFYGDSVARLFVHGSAKIKFDAFASYSVRPGKDGLKLTVHVDPAKKVLTFALPRPTVYRDSIGFTNINGNAQDVSCGIANKVKRFFGNGNCYSASDASDPAKDKVLALAQDSNSFLEQSKAEIAAIIGKAITATPAYKGYAVGPVTWIEPTRPPL